VRGTAFASIVSICLALLPPILAAQETEVSPPALVYPGPARPRLRLPEIEPPEMAPPALHAPELRVPATRGRPSLRWKPNGDPMLELGEDASANLRRGR
jgi:hypothetical protein